MKNWKPSNEELNATIHEYNTSDYFQHYRDEDDVLKYIFIETMPENKELEQVLTKVSLLNDFYSTHIFRTNQMAEHIKGIKDIDERLKSGDKYLVNEIANVEIKSYSMGDDEEKVSRHNFYSFATKFCCNHQPEKYAIYDKYVEQTLWRFIKEDLKYPASVFKRCQLRNYPDFFEMIKKFQEFYHLECKIRDLDRYLWIHGKRLFGK